MEQNQGARTEGNTKEHTNSNEEQHEVMKNTGHKDQDTGNTIHTTAPSVSCVLNKKGYCSFHNKQAEKISITSKKWRDRGGGRGFGYVTRKTTKFICKLRSEPNMSNLISEESRNLANPEQTSSDLTGVSGANHSSRGLPETSNRIQDRQIKRLESGIALMEIIPESELT